MLSSVLCGLGRMALPQVCPNMAVMNNTVR
jgi:hypothetical protein